MFNFNRSEKNSGSGIPYIQMGKIYIVPVLRFRLNFTILVRKAFATLRPEAGKDLIAVTLPPSIDSYLKSTLDAQGSGLMPVMLAIAKWKDEEYKEVLPITPADGLVEAYRIANERNLTWACVDRDLVPGMLVNKTCLSKPKLPDDYAVLDWGVEEYLKAIEGYLETPPTRFDPIDTWREEYIAEVIRRSYPFYRRILLFCEATHVKGIKSLLGTTTKKLNYTKTETISPTITIARAS